MKDRDFPFGEELNIFTSKVRTGKVFTFMEMKESETDIRCLEIPVNAILSDNRPRSDCFVYYSAFREGLPRSLLRGKRTSSEVTETPRLRGGEGYGTCEDEGTTDTVKHQTRSSLRTRR